MLKGALYCKSFCANETCAYKVKYGVHNKRYWKRHTTKPFLSDFILFDETYTCIFCKNLAFCESRCGASMFLVIGHIPSSRYSHLVMHVGLHNHPNADKDNRKALDKMNQMIKTCLEENPSSASSKAISCKLAQREFLQLFVRKNLVMDGKMLQVDVLLEVLEIVSPLFNENKVRLCVYT